VTLLRNSAKIVLTHTNAMALRNVGLVSAELEVRLVIVISHSIGVSQVSRSQIPTLVATIIADGPGHLTL
jgi:hypothetical protein